MIISERRQTRLIGYVAIAVGWICFLLALGMIAHVSWFLLVYGWRLIP